MNLISPTHRSVPQGRRPSVERTMARRCPSARRRPGARHLPVWPPAARVAKSLCEVPKQSSCGGVDPAPRVTFGGA